MPAESKVQQMFMGAELARKRAGEPTKTGMTESQLEDFASTKRKGLHMRVKKYKHGGVVEEEKEELKHDFSDQEGACIAPDTSHNHPTTIGPAAGDLKSHGTFKSMGIGK